MVLTRAHLPLVEWRPLGGHSQSSHLISAGHSGLVRYRSLAALGRGALRKTNGVATRSIAMLAGMAVAREASPADLSACLGIIELLPEFFTPDVPATVRRQFGEHHCWVVAETGAVIGFALVATRSTRTAEILWAAVHPDHRHRGHGTLLIDHVLDALGPTGVHLVEVKTLDCSGGYPPYDATNAFWQRLGFVQVDTIDPLPGWRQGNPAAIYVAALRPTRQPRPATERPSKKKLEELDL